MQNRKHVAHILLQKIPPIIEAWKSTVKKKIPEASELRELNLEDSLPEFLEKLAVFLESQDLDETKTKEVAAEHGEDRAKNSDYSLEEMIEEYRYLRMAIIEKLLEETELSQDIRHDIHSYVDKGILRASIEFQKRNESREKHLISEILMDLPLGVAILEGEDLVYTFSNREHRRLLGNRDVRGMRLAELVPADQKTVTFESMDRVLRTGQTVDRHEILLRLPQGDGSFKNFFVNISYRPLRTPMGEIIGVIAYLGDISDSVRQRHLLEEEKELRERFVLTLTHDLRSPLTAAKMIAQLEARRTEEPGSKKNMERIVSSIDRADRLIRDLLDANHLKAGEGIPLVVAGCDLSSLLHETVDQLREIHGDRFRLIENFRPTGFWDRLALERVMENIAANAVKYGANGETISISTSQEGAGVLIEIHNHGNPIPLEEQRELFKTYGRSASAKKGSERGWGIGLTIVKGIVEGHGGSIRLESSEEKGTSFFINLPLDSRSFQSSKP